MGLKIIFYFILILFFWLFYQRNPVFAVIVIIIAIAGVIFFKIRKNPQSLNFLKGKQSQQNSQVDIILTMMILNDLFHNTNSQHQEKVDPDIEAQNEYYRKTEKELLEILDGE